MSILKEITSITNLNYLSPASMKTVKDYEKKLNLTFAKEYKEYLLNFGVMWFDDHEFTGICDGKRLDVTVVTNDEKAINTFVPDSWYVIEALNIDGIVIWQSSNGELYKTFPNGTIIPYFESFEEYLKTIKTNT